MSFGCTKRDRSALLDLKTVRMPCCFSSGGEAQLLLGDEVRRLWYLNSGTVSFTGAVLVFVICTNRKGYPLETSADDGWFFSPAITDGFSHDKRREEKIR